MKSANLIPIFKKSGRTMTCKYMPVLQAPICCKILEHIALCIPVFFFPYTKEHNILREEQHGFQAGKLCECQLIFTLDDFTSCLSDNSHIDCMYIP